MAADQRHRLLERLDGIGASLERSGKALALLALGSVGVELDRLDEYSDLDFFAIVAAGQKQAFLQDLSWLSSIAPVAFFYRNTQDGFKLLYQDGILAEFAVFEPAELSAIPFSEGRIVWKAAEVDDAIRFPAVSPRSSEPPGREWLIGEALTCLYSGMGRHLRGERLSAQRFIQHFAVDRVLDLMAQLEPGAAVTGDPFSRERRFEKRFPASARFLPGFIQGYDSNPESALAILEFLDVHFEINPFLRGRIREMCESANKTL